MKDREARKQLGLVRAVLEQSGFRVLDKLNDRDDPYIFVSSPNSNLSFAGIRIYKIGDEIAYRVQKEDDTQPFGNAYSLDIEEMYEDLLGEDMDDEEIGKEIITAIGKEIEDFFKRSLEAEEKEDGRHTPPTLGNVFPSGM